MDCIASVSESKPHMDWNFLALSAAPCPLIDALTIGDAGYILLLGYRANSKPSLKWEKSAMQMSQRNVCQPRQRNFSKSEPYQAAS